MAQFIATESYTELTYADMSFVVRRLPTDIRDLLRQNPNSLFVAGGFIRATIADETPSDIDMFGESVDQLNTAAEALVQGRGDTTRLHKTKNATTVISLGRISVQLIHRWLFEYPESCARSFDFTICQAAIWYDGSAFRSCCSPTFYSDLAAKKLIYTTPERIEEVGGSLLRVIKYVQRGYRIPVESLAGVVARLTSAVDPYKAPSESDQAFVLQGLLRAVDPLIAVDGLDVHDDHETPIQGLKQ